MHRDDGTGAGGNGFFDPFGVDTAGHGVNINDDGSGAHIEGSFGSGDPRNAGDDDFIAGSDSQSQQSTFKGHGAVDHPDGMSGTLKFGKFRHKFLFVGSHACPFAGAVDLKKFFFRFRITGRPGRDEIHHLFVSENRCSAIDCQGIHLMHFP